MAKMTSEERKQWGELYEFVRTNVMGYDQNQSLSNHMVLRLRGMLNNKFMANNNVKSTANYSYEVVLNAFKYSMPEIIKACGRVRFADEKHKFNYFLKIVENNLNDVYLKMKNRKKAEEMSDRTETYQKIKSAGYKSRESDDDKFSELW